MLRHSRRLVVFGAAAAGLSGCMAPGDRVAGGPSQPASPWLNNLFGGPQAGGPVGAWPNYDAVYAGVRGEPFPVPPVSYASFDRSFLRQEVAYVGREPPGTIVIDPKAHYLYHVEPGGRAMRYGVGVGKQGFAWSGVAEIRSKQEWPDWYPPVEMIQRRPDIKPQLTKLQSGIGMHGGDGNPLGARAMYLWQGNRDTLFRIHGTVEPDTIGTSVSSGCIRMINQDVMDLYARTAVGTKVVVLG